MVSCGLVQPGPPPPANSSPNFSPASSARISASIRFATRPWPPVVPGTMLATLGGCVAMNVHGKNHARAGAIGRHVRSLTLLTGDGEVRTLRQLSAAVEHIL